MRDFLGIFSKVSIPEPDPRDFGIYGILSTFSYLDPRDFRIFHSEFFLDFQIPREFWDFWYFRSSPKIFYYKKFRFRIPGIGIRDSEKSLPEANSV